VLGPDREFRCKAFEQPARRQGERQPPMADACPWATVDRVLESKRLANRTRVALGQGSLRRLPRCAGPNQDWRSLSWCLRAPIASRAHPVKARWKIAR